MNCIIERSPVPETDFDSPDWRETPEATLIIDGRMPAIVVNTEDAGTPLLRELQPIESLASVQHCRNIDELDGPFQLPGEPVPEMTEELLALANHFTGSEMRWCAKNIWGEGEFLRRRNENDTFNPLTIRTRFELDEHGRCAKSDDYACYPRVEPNPKNTKILFKPEFMADTKTDTELPFEVIQQANKILSKYAGINGFDKDTKVEVSIKEPNSWKNVIVTSDAFVLNPGDVIKNIIHSRVFPTIWAKRQSQPEQTIDLREMRARNTLRRILGERGYFLFKRNGFVSVRGKSGTGYQVFPGHTMTKVYKDGEHVESLCVILNDNYPPTDSLIMRLMLILNNEEAFRSKANISKPMPNLWPDLSHLLVQHESSKTRQLTDIWKQLRKAS